MIQKIRMDMSIGSNIQKRRYQCKLKQDQVIAKMNLMGIPISKSSYAKIETNRMNITSKSANCLPWQRSWTVKWVTFSKI